MAFGASATPLRAVSQHRSWRERNPGELPLGAFDLISPEAEEEQVREEGGNIRGSTLWKQQPAQSKTKKCQSQDSEVGLDQAVCCQRLEEKVGGLSPALNAFQVDQIFLFLPSIVY